MQDGRITHYQEETPAQAKLLPSVEVLQSDDPELTAFLVVEAVHSDILDTLSKYSLDEINANPNLLLERFFASSNDS